MDSHRTSSSQGTKADDKSEEEIIDQQHGPNEGSNTSEDVEKGPGQVPFQVSHASGPHDPFLVTWDGLNDPANPRNWSPWYKASITFLLGMLALSGSLGSSIIAPAEGAIAERFNVSREVTVLCVSLYGKSYPFVLGTASRGLAALCHLFSFLRLVVALSPFVQDRTNMRSVYMLAASSRNTTVCWRLSRNKNSGNTSTHQTCSSKPYCDRLLILMQFSGLL